MKFCVKMEMLAMMVALFLALGVSDGLVIDKCELGNELNSTLPANLLDKITNLVAQIVCHVELSSDFNTSTINQITGPNIRSFFKGDHGACKGRSAESSSEESSEEDIDSSNGAQRRRKSSAESRSEESSEEDVDSSNGAQRRRKSSAESRSEESSEEDVDSSNGAQRRRKSSAESSSKESSEKDIDSSNGARCQRKSAAESSSEESSEEDVESSNGARRRRRSAADSSSEESSEEKIKVPKDGFNSSIVTPVTRPQGNNTSKGKGNRGRKGRSVESSGEECNKNNLWTLYGLFQLPDRIACTSGLEPSLNLCSIPCDNLIDDNISDDIICVETILNKTLAARHKRGPSKALFNKLYAAFFQKECKYVEDFEYFSTC